LPQFLIISNQQAGNVELTRFEDDERDAARERTNEADDRPERQSDGAAVDRGRRRSAGIGSGHACDARGLQKPFTQPFGRR
jgi:hypothetical protein